MLGNILNGRYQIISYLGGGGFGETYIAHDIHLPGSPQCLVKKLKPQSKNLEGLDTIRRLFKKEAEVLYQLGSHDRIPQLLAYFEENAEFYLVQEFIAGHDLAQELTPGTILAQTQVVILLQEILEILDFVHQQKVIHRDVNPRNIIRREVDGKLVLIDFGAVKQITTQFILSPEQTKLTIAIGTPGYIPSEQAQGNPKFSSDIYALGILAIQALTGLSPDEMTKDPETNEIIWQESAKVSGEFAQFIDKMVYYDFRQRHASATIALKKLRELTQTSLATIALAPAATLNPIPQNQPQKFPKVRFLHLILIIFLVSLSGVAAAFIRYHLNNKNAQQLSIQGNTFLQLQHYQDALAVYEESVNLQPNYAPGWYGKGKALFKLRKYSSALAAFDHAIELQPSYLEAWNQRGFTLVNLQHYNEAISAFDRVLQLNQDSAEIWQVKGDILRKMHHDEQAIAAYAKAIDLQPHNYELWHKKASSLQDLARYDEAVTAYNKVIDLQADDQLAWYNLGNCLVNLHRYEDALKAYDKAVQYKPSDYLAWLSRSNVLMTLRRYPEASDSLGQIVKQYPRSYRAWYNLGWVLHQERNYGEAIGSYQQAISLKGHNYLGWYALGNSQYSLKQYPQAIASYSRAIHYKPNHSASWYSQGNALVQLQRYPEAILSYEQAIKYKPDYQPAIDALNQAQQKLRLSNHI